MLDGAFMQETSNIIEDTFSAYNICKGRMFEEINNDTLHLLWVQKNTSNEGLVFAADKAISKTDIYFKGYSTWDEVPKTGNSTNKSAYFQCTFFTLKGH